MKKIFTKEDYHDEFELVLEEGIEEIGECAFCNSRLKKITLPSTLKRINRFAFADTQLNSIILPDKLERIDRCSFLDCKNLKKLTLPSSVIELEEWCFSGSGIEELVIDGNIEFLDNFKFRKMYNLKKVYIHGNVKRMDFECFQDSKVEEIEVPGTVNTFHYIKKEDDFRTTQPLKKVILHEGIKALGDYCFNNTSIESLVIPASIKSIHYLSLSNCKKLKTLTFMGPVENTEIFFCSDLELDTLYLNNYSTKELRTFLKEFKTNKCCAKQVIWVPSKNNDFLNHWLSKRTVNLLTIQGWSIKMVSSLTQNDLILPKIDENEYIQKRIEEIYELCKNKGLKNTEKVKQEITDALSKFNREYEDATSDSTLKLYTVEGATIELSTHLDFIYDYIKKDYFDFEKKCLNLLEILNEEGKLFTPPISIEEVLLSIVYMEKKLGQNHTNDKLKKMIHDSLEKKSMMDYHTIEEEIKKEYQSIAKDYNSYLEEIVLLDSLQGKKQGIHPFMDEVNKLYTRYKDDTYFNKLCIQYNKYLKELEEKIKESIQQKRKLTKEEKENVYKEYLNFIYAFAYIKNQIHLNNLLLEEYKNKDGIPKDFENLFSMYTLEKSQLQVYKYNVITKMNDLISQYPSLVKEEDRKKFFNDYWDYYFKMREELETNDLKNKLFVKAFKKSYK